MLPTLGHTTVKVLPPNTTSTIQLCDARIMAAMKKHFKVIHMELEIDLLETNYENIYSVNILSAMLAFKEN